MASRAQAAGDFSDMGGAGFAAAANNRGALCDPVHDMIGIGIGAQIAARGQGIDRGAVLQEAPGNLCEPIGIGPKGRSPVDRISIARAMTAGTEQLAGTALAP